MITKYTRKDINKNPQLHSEEFVLQRDCEEFLQKFVDAAVKAGADLDELMKGLVMMLEAGETYVFKDEASKSGFINADMANGALCDDLYSCGFTIDEVIPLGHGLIGGRTVIHYTEIKYFKLKEEKQMKPDDIISVEMSALEGMMIKSILGKTAICSPHTKLSELLTNSEACPDDVVSVSYKYSELKVWCLAQFKNPKQDKIDELEKKINDAAAELAKLKGE